MPRATPSFGSRPKPPAAKVPALLPAGKYGALLQVAALKPIGGNVVSGQDRSGFARHCNDIPGANTGPSHIPGRAAWDNGKRFSGSTGVMTTGNVAALRILGELTLLVVLSTPAIKPEGNEQYVFQSGRWVDGNAASAALYSLGIGGLSPAGATVFYYCEWWNGSSKSGNSWATPSLPQLVDGSHHFVCLRRNAAATQITIDVDGTSYASPANLHPPSNGENASLQLGAANTSPVNLHCTGTTEDFNVIGRRLTDDEVAEARAIMMGL